MFLPLCVILKTFHIRIKDLIRHYIKYKMSSIYSHPYEIRSDGASEISGKSPVNMYVSECTFVVRFDIYFLTTLLKRYIDIDFRVMG